MAAVTLSAIYSDEVFVDCTLGPQSIILPPLAQCYIIAPSGRPVARRIYITLTNTSVDSSAMPTANYLLSVYPSAGETIQYEDTTYTDSSPLTIDTDGGAVKLTALSTKWYAIANGTIGITD